MDRLRESFRISATVPLLMFGVMVCVSAVNSVEQVRARPDPQTQLLNNYRQYPDRYIRISDETWRYDDLSHAASHSFTMKNIAGVAYAGIEIRVNYMSASGKTLQSQTLKIPGILPAYGTRKIHDLKAQNVPAKSDQAILAVTKGFIHP
jgi:hypothetical protein